MPKERVIAAGVAMVDLFVRGAPPGSIVPEARADLPNFLLAAREVNLKAGGKTTNVAKDFLAFTKHENFIYLATVGKDYLGDFFINQHPKFQGIRRSEDKFTGAVAFVLDAQNAVSNFRAYRDAANELPELPRRINSSLFITEATYFMHEFDQAEVDAFLGSLREKTKRFALNIGGCRPDAITKENLARGVTVHPPDIVVGNYEEMRYLSGLPATASPEAILQSAASQLFPRTQLVVMTQAEKGATLLLNGELLPHVPAVFVPVEETRNHVGLGDTSMGILLGGLFGEELTAKTVTKAAKTAAFGAAQLVKKAEGRLTDEDYVRIRRVHAARRS